MLEQYGPRSGTGWVPAPQPEKSAIKNMPTEAAKKVLIFFKIFTLRGRLKV
jgi:hypothetical protein